MYQCSSVKLSTTNKLKDFQLFINLLLQPPTRSGECLVAGAFPQMCRQTDRWIGERSVTRRPADMRTPMEDARAGGELSISLGTADAARFDVRSRQLNKENNRIT